MGSKSQSYNENFISLHHQTKNVDSSRKHQTKKQIFGEIKNVIHNQGFVTPLKPDQAANRSTASKYLSSATVKNKQRNETKCVSQHSTHKTKSEQAIKNEISFLDCFDFRGKCCSNVGKSDQEIWSEMNLFDDSYLNKIVDVDQQYSDDEPAPDIPNLKDDDANSEFVNDIKEEFNFNYWPDINNVCDQSDLHLFLEKPCSVDFQF